MLRSGSCWHICCDPKDAKASCWPSCTRIFLNASRIAAGYFWRRLNFNGTSAEAKEAEVSDFWLPVGKNQGRVVLKLAGIDSISAAEGLGGLDVIVPLEERVPLDDEANYISDLVGCTVFDGTTAVGVIEDVQFATTADGLRRLEEAAPMLVVMSPEGDEVLVPFAKDFLVRVNAGERRVEMVSAGRAAGC